MFNIFIFNAGPASYGKRFLFSFFNRSSLSFLVSISPIAPYFFLTLIFFLSLILFLSRPHFTPPTSSRCCAIDLSWSYHSPILPGAADLSLSVVVVVFLMVVGCFDCWWLADFGWWWWVDRVVGVRFGIGLDMLFLWLWMGLTSIVADIGCGGWCCGVCFWV